MYIDDIQTGTCQGCDKAVLVARLTVITTRPVTITLCRECAQRLLSRFKRGRR